MEAEALHPIARLVEVDWYFDLDLFPFLFVHPQHFDLGGGENAGNVGARSSNAPKNSPNFETAYT